MYGAIYGDLVGSIYEFDEYKKHDKQRMIKASEESKLVTEESFISDDTILTIAIADASLNHDPYSRVLRRYILDNLVANRQNYFQGNFSKTTAGWARGENSGVSSGNGAMMRISPVPLVFDDINDIVSNTISATTPTHNTQEAVKAALCVTRMIYMARAHKSKTEIENMVREKFGYNFDYTLDELRNISKFNQSCKDTMPLILHALFSTNSFDDAIRLTLSYGKDTDTNCCIVGSIAEHIYGVPDYVKEIVESKIPNEYKEIVDSVYTRKLT